MRPQGIDDLGALAYQHIARAMLHQLTLLFGRFDPHEAHGRSPNRFADRLGVSRIVLVALDVDLDVLRWHQPQPVAKLREFTCPVMGRGAGLHAVRHGGNALKNSSTWRRRSRFRTTTFSAASIP